MREVALQWRSLVETEEGPHTVSPCEEEHKQVPVEGRLACLVRDYYASLSARPAEGFRNRADLCLRSEGKCGVSNRENK